MCLEKVYKDKPNVWRYGWKVFRTGKRGGLYGEYFNHSKIRPVNKWLDAEKYMNISPSFYDYQMGWHVFRYKKDAKSWNLGCNIKTVFCLRKVKVKEPLTHGEQDDLYIGVFGKIYILDDRK